MKRLIRYTTNRCVRVCKQPLRLSALPLYSSRKYVSIDNKDIVRPKMDIAEIAGTEDHPVLEKKPQEIILEQERHVLQTLRSILTSIEADPKDLELIQRVETGLEELFLLVVVGEFNAGKSSFINALLGDHFLKDGRTPTTNNLHLIRHGPLKTVLDDQTGLSHISIPLAWLNNITLVDTPGTNAIIKKHQEVTEHFVPRSDLVIFITSAERPFSESEHEFLDRIKQWGKKILVVINKYDLLQKDQERQEVEKFVRDGIIKMLGFEPLIFCVSSREALNEKTSHDPFDQSNNKPSQNQHLQESWKAMENHIFDTLNSIERVKLKLENPLGVANNMLGRYHSFVAQRIDLLRGDRSTLDNIDRSLEEFSANMKKEFELQQNRLDGIIYALTERANLFFDEYITLSNVTNIINKDVVSQKFQKQVIGDLSTKIETHISEVIDWMLDRKYKQWKAVTDYVNKRAKVSTNEEKLVGSLQSEFNFNRKELLLSIGQSADSVLSNYSSKEESQKLNTHITEGLTTTAVVGVSAVGIGTASWFLAPTAIASSLGMLGAVAFGASSLYVIPYKRSQMRKAFAKSVDNMRNQLRSSMTQKFDSELDESISSIKSAISPYSQFVNVEYNKFKEQNNKMEQIKSNIEKLKTLIEALDK
ncbi:hypothetical protein AKO1_010617 [Acrasis kona]|uniref:G domain-containing protein n=1 Tax=Acrasis kona TaxID=1008807 RepID=A0AAW2ZJZ1_9EUKA